MNTRRLWLLTASFAALFLSFAAMGQSLTGALIGTVVNSAGQPVRGAAVCVTSPALIGGPATLETNEKGQFRFTALPPGVFKVEVWTPPFAPYRESGITIGAGSTIERSVVLQHAGMAETIVVEGTGPRVEARHPGVMTRFGPDDLRSIPVRRSSMFDFLRLAPGISPTSSTSGAVTTVSAFGSGINENAFLIDGTNFTCPCNGIARSEPGLDFIHEIQVQSIGASAEYGNLQGAVVNVVTKQGGERFLFDASYYAQTEQLTSSPVALEIPGARGASSGYARLRYHDITANLGGPVLHERLWFFAGYESLRDYDSQPGTDRRYPRRYEQGKLFAKLTWRLGTALTLLQNIHHESWASPEQPTITRPFEATLDVRATVPAITFAHLTHVVSPTTMWDARAGRFAFEQESRPATANLATPGRSDRVTGMFSGAPAQFGDLTLIRTTGKATLTRYRPSLWGADHDWKLGTQLERGEHRVTSVIPSGERFVDRNGQPSQKISRAPFHIGGQSLSVSGFITDAMTIANRATVSIGLRFDHSRAISQDLAAVDLEGRLTDDMIDGLGAMYTWNVVSPRLGVTTRLSSDGGTVARASYGRFYQGVLTGELDAFHPGSTPVTTADAVTGRIISVVDARNLRYDPEMRAPFTDEYSIGIDREVNRSLTLAAALIRKRGRNFIGWTDVGGSYREEVRTLADGRSVPVRILTSPPSTRRFLLANQPDYSLAYDGVVLAFDKRRSRWWQASGSYTYSRAFGLQPSNGTAAAPQVSTISPPFAPGFGRDPNDLTNARGRLANDRPHMLRLRAMAEIPRAGLSFGGSFQYVSGKPWAASAQVALPQNSEQRVQLEPRGTRRLSAQTLLDLRLSRPFRLRGGEVELLIDVLNALDDSAEESLASETIATETLATVPAFGRPNVFIDPRRAMIGVRFRTH